MGIKRLKQTIWRVASVVTILTIAGCSSQLAYRFADTAIEWEVDNYVDLDNAQEQRLSQRIDGLHLWHAQVELPKYRQQLKQLRDDLANGNIDQQRVAAVYEQLWQLWHNIQQRVYPEALLLLPQLTAEQRQQLLTNLQEKLDERREKYQQRAQQPIAERRSEQIDEQEERLQDWLGYLTDQQRQLVADNVSQRVSDTTLWLAYRQRWLDEFAGTLQAGSEQPDFAERLRLLLTDPAQLRSAQLNETMQQQRQQQIAFYLSLYQSLSERQRQHLLAKADDYLILLGDLIDEYQAK